MVRSLQALEAAEPVELISNTTAQSIASGGVNVRMGTAVCMQARLLSAALKLKERAQQEQLRRIQVGLGVVYGGTKPALIRDLK